MIDPLRVRARSGGGYTDWCDLRGGGACWWLKGQLAYQSNALHEGRTHLLDGRGGTSPSVAGRPANDCLLYFLANAGR